MKKSALVFGILICLIVAFGSRNFFKEVSRAQGDASSKAPASAMTPREVATVEQAKAKASPKAEPAEVSALSRLNATSLTEWVARSHGTERIRTLVGGRWKPRSTNVENAAREFIREFSAPLFAVESQNLKLERVQASADRTSVSFQQTLDGKIIYGATLKLFFENGEVARVQSDLEPDSGRRKGQAPALSLEQTFDLYAKFNDEAKLHVAAPAREVWYASLEAFVPALEFSVREAGVGYRILWDRESARVIKKFKTQLP